MSPAAPAAEPTYARNGELFADFYALQGRFVGCLAGHPQVIRAWLDGLPPRDNAGVEAGGPARRGRTARLCFARRRELADLVAGAGQHPGRRACLEAWLLRVVPVCTYLDMAGAARPALAALDPAAGECFRDLLRLRDHLFSVNYGLARAAVQVRGDLDGADQLSAASCGLLDAIDRYVPGDRAARFGYFAGYWIRYHLGRTAQKCGSTVTMPINQHRIGRRIEGYLARRRSAGLPPPTETQLCDDLEIGRDACYWHRRQPRMVPLQAPPEADRVEDAPAAWECRLSDPAPVPAAAVEASEMADDLRRLFRVHTVPATRVMLAYSRQLGSLPEAAEDYLGWLEGAVLGTLRRTRGRRS